MDYTAEVQAKLARVRAMMDREQVGAVWLRSVSNVAWITGGVDTAVNTADSAGVASVVITDRSATVVTSTIEAPRLAAEDDVEGRGFKLEVSPWEGALPINFGSTLATDMPLDGAKDISRALKIERSRLLPAEIERFRALGATCAEAMLAAIDRIQPGQTEYEIAAGLEYETYRRGARPVVVLVATDERIYKVRHPLPTGKVMDKYAMLVLCARSGGLTCSITRLVHFGALPDELKQKQQACAAVDAAIIAASQPGKTLEELFGVLQTAYADAGFDGEWKLHHQGGIAGYDPRELIAVPGEKTALEAGMVCAWNPSITGTKCEDTILVPEAGGASEILTPTAGWPSVKVAVGGQTLARPLIKEVV
jgi:Xaa-Pro aminopeptidase